MDGLNMAADGYIRDIGNINRMHVADAANKVVSGYHGGADLTNGAHLFIIVEDVEGADVTDDRVNATKKNGWIVGVYIRG